MISFVSPIFQAEDTVEELVSEISNLMSTIGSSYEVILVDDRSTDNSWNILKDLANKKQEVKCLRLSRNFGQHPAIHAGLSQCKGDWVVVMDCDLQDRPKEVLKLYNKALEGYDLVLARRKKATGLKN